MLATIRGVFLLLLLCAGIAQAADTGWMQTPQNTHARVRISAEQNQNSVNALLQVELAPGWKTYWRSPGAGGVAPAIKWSGDTRAQWFWPTPQRFDISGISTQGYDRQVTIPLVIEHSGTAPLSGTLTLSTCSNVCVLTDYPFTLDLNQGADAQFDRAFSDAMATIPAQDGVTQEVSARQQGDQLLITARTSDNWQLPSVYFDPLSNGVTPGEPTLEVNGSELTVKVPVTDEWGEGAGNLSGEPLSMVIADGDKAQYVTATINQGDATAGTQPAAAGSLWAMLLMALAGGLILNLMPCVLPVMGMKLGSVLSAGADRQRIRLRFLLTTAGILTSFAVLAALVTALKLSGITPGWGTQFQNPWFIGFLVVVSFLFALSLLGLVQLLLPSALNNRLATAGGNSLSGSFYEGAFATLMATPCSAPFLGTAVAWAFSASLPEMWLIFLTLGLGMSLPWLLVALVPRVALWLPKPGRWMNTLKVLLGLMMFGSSLWLVTLLSSHTGPTVVAVISLVMVWVTLEALLKTHDKTHRGALLLTAVLAAAGGWQIHALVDPTYVNEKTSRSAAINWQPLSEEALSQALAANKKVFVDVSADWCITCKVNELRVLKRPEVIEALNQPDVVALRGDWSQPSQAISDFLQKRNAYAIPFNQVYQPGDDRGHTLPTLLDTSGLLDALNKSN